MEVAIQKCPYCKAIIDEGEEFCTNCGTKLLFNEDESIEEEIPGEKIVEEEEKAKKIKPAKKSTASKKKAASQKKTAKATAATKKKSESPAKKKKKTETAAKKTRKKSVKIEEVMVTDEIENKAVEEAQEIPEQVPEFSDFTPPEREETEVDYIPDQELDVDADRRESFSDENADVEGFEDFPAEPESDEGVPSFDEEIAPVEIFMEEKAQDLEFSEDVNTYPDSPEIDSPEGEEMPEFSDDRIADPEDTPVMDEQCETGETEVDQDKIEPQPDGNTEEMLFTEEKQETHLSGQDENMKFQSEDEGNEADAVEKEKVEIEKFLDTLKKERQEVNEDGIPSTGELPPWAASLKEGQVEDAAPIEEEIPEEAPEQRKDAFDGVETDILLEEPRDVPNSEEFSIGEITPDEIPVDDVSIEEPMLSDELPVDDVSIEEPMLSDETPVDDVSIEEPALPDEMPEDELAPDITVQTDKIQIPDSDTELPEAIDQQALPFDEEAESGKKVRRKKKKTGQPRLRISTLARARIFDVLFIAGIWIISLWVASWVAEVSIIQLIRSSILPLVCYYFALLVIYFFFFLFFLRETLGDNLFSTEE